MKCKKMRERTILLQRIKTILPNKYYACIMCLMILHLNLGRLISIIIEPYAITDGGP